MLLGLLRAAASEAALHTRIGQWRQAVSTHVSALLENVSVLQTEMDAVQAEISDIQIAEGFLTQSAWYVNKLTGNDANDGTTAGTALQTTTELSRRWAGRAYGAVPQVDVYIVAGDFSEDTLEIPSMVFTDFTVVVFHGQSMTQAAVGTITGYAAYNPGALTQAVLTDAGQNFSTHKQKRIRVTSGASAGAATSFTSLRGGNTAINVGQFSFEPNAGNFWSGYATDPGIGDTYVVEDWVTTFFRFNFMASGPVQVVVKDIKIAPTFLPSYNNNVVSNASVLGDRNATIFWGCKLDSTGLSILLLGALRLDACLLVGDGLYYERLCDAMEQSCVICGITRVNGTVSGTGNLHDGDGARAVTRYVEAGVHTEQGHRVFRGNTGVHIELTDFGGWSAFQGTANARFWSEAPAASANTGAHALHVANGCGFTYVTKPTATAGVAGNDVKLAAGAVIAWAAVPAIAAAPDNAYVNVRH